MANCPNCGAMIPENTTEAFCGSCGHPIEKQEQQAETASANDLVGKCKELLAKFKAGNMLKVAGAVVVAILAIVLISGLFSGSKMDPIKDYVKAINKEQKNYLKLSAVTTGKYGKMENEISKMWAKYSSDSKDYYEDKNDALEELYEEIEDEYGKWKLSFEKKDVEKIKGKDFKDDYKEEWEEYTERFEDRVDDLKDVLKDKDDLEDFADDNDISKGEARKILKKMIKYYKKLSKTKLTAAYEIDGRFIVKADGETYKTNSGTILVAKIGGEWVLLDHEGFYFEDEALLNRLLNYFYGLV